MKWTAKIDECTFVTLSDLLDELKAKDTIVEKLSAGSTFTWGDTNRSMVTTERFLMALDLIDDEGYEADMEELMARTESLDDFTYIDIAN